MTCGIYSLNFSGTNKIYIGQSVDIETRFIGHLSSMRHNNSPTKLQEAYNNYGMPTYKILLECLRDELDYNENEAIVIFNACDNGFNTLDTAGASPKYTACGESHIASKYTNKQIEEVFLMIVHSTKTLREISDITGVSYAIVRTISCGGKHKWLKDKFPEEYNSMRSNSGKRNILNINSYGNSKYSRDNIYKAFCLLIENKLKRKAIAELCDISYATVGAIACGGYPWLRKEYPEMYKVMMSK